MARLTHRCRSLGFLSLERARRDEAAGRSANRAVGRCPRLRLSRRTRFVREEQDLGQKMGRHHRNQLFATHAQPRHRRPAPTAHRSETSSSGGRQPRSPAGWLRRRCRWAAARLRTATGVTRFALEREHRAEQRTPWLGLLLWALACVGLFVSLLMQAEDLRAAAREVTQMQRPSVPYASALGGRTFVPALNGGRPARGYESQLMRR